MQLKTKSVEARRIVEVIDRGGHVLRLYAVALEDADCDDAEYEEAALILAEQDGLGRRARRLRARCVGKAL
ncbi:MAG TPA: hypothetical protein VG843_05935 [Rhizomicrobium sp.]|nr:hypothetical protein [Rhizomicrobium sp.]